jgi:hypothetical protein
MCAQETKVEEFVQEWDHKAVRARPDMYLSDAVALRLETNLQGIFSARHWLRDRVARHLIAYYEATNRPDSALPLAKKSAQFTAETYPGRSALYAWALEAQGDLMLRLQGFTVEGPSNVEAPLNPSADVLRRAMREVLPLYTEATQILSTLFGQDHDFHCTMVDKRDALMHVARPQNVAVGRF